MLERTWADKSPMYVAVGFGGLIALFLSFYAAPAVTLGVLALIGASLAFFSPRAALYLIVPAMAFSPEFSVGGLLVRIEDLLMVPLAAGWLAHLCVFKDRQGTPLDRPVLAYWAVGLVATLWGGYLGTAHFLTLNKELSSIFHLLKRLEFVFLFFIVADVITSRRDVQKLTWWLIASMVALNLYGLAEYLSTGAIPYSPGASGHELGVASMIAVPLSVALVPVSRSSSRLLFLAVIVFSLAVLPLTLGRNFIAVTVLILLYVGIVYARSVLLLIPAALAIAYGVYPQFIQERLSTFLYVLSPDLTGNQGDAASILYRATAPGNYSLLALAHSPVLGFGLASLPLGFIDSEYGTQLVYTGIVGLLVFFAFGIRLFRLAKEARSLAREPFMANLAWGLQLVLASYAIYSIFAASISPTHTGGLFFIVAGLIVALHRSLARPRAMDSP